MSENSPKLSTQQPSSEQLAGGLPPINNNSNSLDSTRLVSGQRFRRIRQNFLEVLAKGELYEKYEPHARNVKIILQMLIGIFLGIFLLLKVFADIFKALGSPSLHLLAALNPLDIVAYGLFFSTGVDLAYMLFTPGPDEAIDPLMTGLAAAILYGIARIDFAQIQQGISLFLAIGALAGLFAIRKYLYEDKMKDTTKN